MYTLNFIQAYDVDTILNSGVPDANDTTFHQQVESRIVTMLSVIQGRPGIRRMQVRLVYNNSTYSIRLQYTVA